MRDTSKRIGWASKENAVNYEEIDLRFPINLMRGVAGDFAQAYSEKLESPVQFFYMTFLTYLGAWLGDRVRLASILRTQPRLYTVLVGASASSKKSTALEMAAPYFKDKLYTSFKVGSGEGLSRILSENQNVLLYFDELATLLRQTRQEASTLLSLVTQLFNRNVAENQLSSKQNSFRIENAYLSIVAACTEKTYQKLFDEAALDIGFVNRLFLVHGGRDKYVADPVDVSEIDQESIREWIIRIDAKFPPGTKLTKSANARHAYRDWYVTLKDSEESKRIDEYAQRVAMLMAISKLDNEVSKDTMLDSIDLMEWQLKVRGVYQPYEATNGIGAIEERIERVLLARGRLAYWDLARLVGIYRYGGRKAFEFAIQNLTQQGILRVLSSIKSKPDFELTEDYYHYVSK